MSFPGFFNGVASFANATQFEGFSDNSTQSTTSNGWVTYDSYTTTETYDAGKLFIGWALQYTNSDKEKRVGIRIQYRLTSVGGSWTTLSDTRPTVGFDNAYEEASSFREVDTLTDDQIDLRVQFGQTDDGGTGRIRNVNLIIYRIGDT